MDYKKRGEFLWSSLIYLSWKKRDCNSSWLPHLMHARPIRRNLKNAWSDKPVKSPQVVTKMVVSQPTDVNHRTPVHCSCSLLFGSPPPEFWKFGVRSISSDHWRSFDHDFGTILTASHPKGTGRSYQPRGYMHVTGIKIRRRKLIHQGFCQLSPNYSDLESLPPVNVLDLRLVGRCLQNTHTAQKHVSDVNKLAGSVRHLLIELVCFYFGLHHLKTNGMASREQLFVLKKQRGSRIFRDS